MLARLLARLLALSCLTAVAAGGATLYTSGCESAFHRRRDGEAGVKAYQAKLIARLKADGYIADAWAEGGTLAVVPGPEWAATDPAVLKVFLGSVAEALCGSREAPVVMRGVRPAGEDATRRTRPAPP